MARDRTVFDFLKAITGAAPTVSGVQSDFQLNPEQILLTVASLKERTGDRFPGRGVGRLVERLEDLASGITAQLEWVQRPLFGIRLIIVGLVLAAAGLAIRVMVSWRLPSGITTLVDLAEVMDAFMNEIIVVGAGLFFLFTLEGRVKRRRALKSLRELRALAHIIDMHQLTKDPARIQHSVTHPGGRVMSREDLVLYLDLCSEMLALVAKLAALYAQHIDDAVVLAAVDEVEGLTSGLSAKIWQKIVILEGALPA